MASRKPKHCSCSCSCSCSCCVLSIYCVSCNKVVLHCNFTHYINEQFVFDPRQGSEMFSLLTRPDRPRGHSSFTEFQDVSVPREKTNRGLKLTTVFDTEPRFRVRGFLLPLSPPVCTAWCLVNQNRRLTLHVSPTAITYLSTGQLRLFCLGRSISYVRTDTLRPVGTLMAEAIPRGYQQPHLQITFPALLIKRLYKRDSIGHSFICKYKFNFANMKILLNLEAIN
jgi:hypothetical protein